MNQRETGTDPRERTWNPHDLAARAPPRPRTRHGGRRHGAQRRAGAMSNWAPEQAVLALRLQPSNVELISLVASARMQDGDRKGALKVLRRALKIAPSDALLYSRLGSVLASGGALSELPAAELRLLTKVAGAAAALRPSDAALHYNLGLAHAASGEPARSVTRCLASSSPSMAATRASCGCAARR